MEKLQQVPALFLVRKQCFNQNIQVIKIKNFVKIRLLLQIFKGGNDKATWKGITLFFDKVIETKDSEFQMNARTMISFFGGIVGYCKNTLWLIILLCSSLSYMIFAFRDFIAQGFSGNKSFD